MKVAIVGSGISGLGAAHRLQGQAEVTLFEASDYFGGHTHTVDLTLNGPGGSVTHGVDTGFLVFNERTYPTLIRLFSELDIPCSRSDMSFSVQVPGDAGRAALEWSGSSLNTVFAQRRNLLNPQFIGMLRSVLRFNALATRLATAAADHEPMQPLSEFLDQHGFSQAFRDWYFLPMLGCIWSCPTDQMLQFPVATMLRFCHNHGLLQVRDRPQWWTVSGGARRYVEAITSRLNDRRLNCAVRRIKRDDDGVLLTTDAGTQRYDKLILATHSDQALALLAQPSPREQAVLGAIRYQPNRAVLHTDRSVLPGRPLAWAAWNYERSMDTDQPNRVCLHYLLNRLQPLPFTQPVLVSLNPVRDIDPHQIHAAFDYAHPVFDRAAILAQDGVAGLQGRHHTYFCGAWTGYGFHEDGLKSGLAAAAQLLTDTGRSTGTTA
ncbi:MAG: FAD-dependent oxidoreductase [Rhodoferax sp.]|nr:FAD-dependent oxidoreductase [Rhodoferax sp.]